MALHTHSNLAEHNPLHTEIHARRPQPYANTQKKQVISRIYKQLNWAKWERDKWGK